jgi:hypothetical protein
MTRPISTRVIPLLVATVLAVLVWGSMTTPVAAERTAAGARLQRLLSKLNEPMDMKDFQAPMVLKEALGLIQDKLNTRYKDEDVLPILVDGEAFKAESGENADIYDAPIRFPTYPRQITVATALRLIVSQITAPKATFIVRDRFIEITTAKAGSLPQLLKQKVFADLDRRPLAEAIELLSAPKGVSVLLDPRLGDKLKTPVTAALINDTTLEGALRLLTDMAGVKLYVSEDGVYVTSPANAELLEKEARARRQERREREEEARRRKEGGSAQPSVSGKK